MINWAFSVLQTKGLYRACEKLQPNLPALRWDRDRYGYYFPPLWSVPTILIEWLCCCPLLMAYLNSITHVERRDGLIVNYSVHVLEGCKRITNSGPSSSRDIRTRVVRRMRIHRSRSSPNWRVNVQTRNLTNTVTHQDTDESQTTRHRVDSNLGAFTQIPSGDGRGASRPALGVTTRPPGGYHHASGAQATAYRHPDIPEIVLQRRRFVRTSELRTQGVRFETLLSLNDIAEHRKNGAIHTHYYNN